MGFVSPARICCACLVLVVGSAAFAQPPATIFAEQCSGCHTIGGGPGAGPDLKDVAARRSRAWLLQIIRNPQRLVAAKDPAFMALRNEFAGMEMPAFPDVTNAEAGALLDYIAQQSGTMSRPPEPQPASHPQSLDTGKRLFTGERRLARGGAPCVSCHTVRGIGGLGGGRLGPDLTRSFERLGKAKGMAGWLSVTPTPVIATAYKRNALSPDEIGALTAFVQQASTAGIDGGQDARLLFIGLAAGCTLLGLVAIGGTWRKRLRGVRENLESQRGDDESARRNFLD